MTLMMPVVVIDSSVGETILTATGRRFLKIMTFFFKSLFDRVISFLNRGLCVCVCVPAALLTDLAKL